jgi:hypothetical protein
MCGEALSRSTHSDGNNNVCTKKKKKKGPINEEAKKKHFDEGTDVFLLTLMTIKDLHDLASLQIPQVDFAVFAAGHDPFASGDAEARADAVLGVLVADVGL